MSQPFPTNSAKPALNDERKQEGGGQNFVPDGLKSDPNPTRAPMMNGPPVRGGAPFIIYDPNEFQDRSESTWAHCPHCKQIGMSVLKLEYSCRSHWGNLTNDQLSHETVHRCAFCNHELGRRKNPTLCCCC